MSRTPLKERVLPNYTRKEEMANMFTHAAGVLLGIWVLVAGILISLQHGSGLSLTGAIIYGISMIVLYAVSSVYHGLKHTNAKLVMQVIDHCTIYLLIIGTYTPILLASILPNSPVTAWLILGGEVALSAVGIVFTAIDHNKFRFLSMALYIIMGWLIVFAIVAAIKSISLAGFMWLLAGGIVYTIGAVLYGIGKKKSVWHTVFHVLTIVASVMQAVCVLGYVL